MQLKEILFKVSFLYNFLTTSYLMKLVGKKNIHIFYHFIESEDDVNNLVNNLYKAKSKKQFKEDIFFFKNNFIALDIHDFNSSKKNGQGFLMSFDDGLSNFNKIVVPILIAENLTAINFLNSDFIDNESLFYRYKANLLLNIILNKKPSEKQKEQITILLETYGVKTTIIPFLKESTIKEVIVIDEIAKVLDFSFTAFLKNEKPYLTSKQIVAMQDKGFYFGAHSKSHPRFSGISLNEQVKETLESVNIIKKKFKLKEGLFSFPFSDDGVTKQFFKEIENEDIITFGSSGLKDELLKNHYQRIQMEYQKRVYSAETIVKGELIYYFLKKLLNRHITKRSA